MLQELLVKLEALSLYYQNIHWTVSGPNFYSDHLLAERLYSAANGLIDGVAEKAVGTTKDRDLVKLPDVLKKVYPLINNLPYCQDENVKYFRAALVLVQDIIVCVTTNEKTEGVSLGVKNMLADIADKLEVDVYLLNQRCGVKTRLPN